MNLSFSSVLSYLRGATAAAALATTTTVVALPSSLTVAEETGTVVLVTPESTASTRTSAVTPKPDLYVMAMSHQAEFCFQHKHDDNHDGIPPSANGCQHPMDYWKTHLTIHGLWPEYKDGTWPSMCTREPIDHQVMKELRESLEVYWPNIRDVAESDEHHDDFWKHEWTKHGTCSGLSQKEYFWSALQHALPTPDLISQHDRVNKAALLEAYGGADRVVVVCAGKQNNYLSEVRSCLAVGENGLPQEQIQCPPKTLEENNCDDIILISKFPKTKEAE